MIETQNCSFVPGRTVYAIREIVNSCFVLCHWSSLQQITRLTAFKIVNLYEGKAWG